MKDRFPLPDEGLTKLPPPGFEHAASRSGLLAQAIRDERLNQLSHRGSVLLLQVATDMNTHCEIETIELS